MDFEKLTSKSKEVIQDAVKLAATRKNQYITPLHLLKVLLDGSNDVIANLILNYVLIKRFGGNGAAFSTLLCYIGMFLARAIHSRRYLEIKWKVGRFAGTFLMLCAQSALALLYHGQFWYPIQLVMFLVICAANAQDILLSIKKVLRRA